jgi:selenide,water dikinase
MNQLPRVEDPRLIVGLETGDDAGVFRLTDDLALVQTVDVFTPVVDDPYTFGQIVAANCLSDVWAMGGDVLTALNLFGYPKDRLDADDAALILRGCSEKIREAGAVLCGGHTWVDLELKAGLAVTGFVHPQKAVTNAGARPGDALVLTKPLGGGIIALASARDMVDTSIMEPVVQSMIELNKTASNAMREVGVNAATDVTGFSLMGHASIMAAASGVGLEIYSRSVPVFLDALDLAEKDVFLPLGQSNEISFEDQVRFHASVSKAMVRVLFDPQTSGGLLISVERNKQDILLDQLHEQGILSARIIGKATEGEKGKVQVF